MRYKLTEEQAAAGLAMWNEGKMLREIQAALGANVTRMTLYRRITLHSAKSGIRMRVYEHKCLDGTPAPKPRRDYYRRQMEALEGRVAALEELCRNQR